MNLFKEKSEENRSSILSATNPNTILKTGYESKQKLQTRLKQKVKIQIYIDENKFYVAHSTAYALGLIKTRAIMLDSPKLIEISSEIHNKLKSNDSIEIEYIKIEKKQSLKVYVNSSDYCIDISAAYALGLISVEEFNNANDKYYYINENIVTNLKENFDVEFYSLNLEKDLTSKNR